MRISRTPEEITDLVGKLMQQSEVAFDTETTDIDANLADMVGMSFCWMKGTAYYVTVPAEREGVLAILEQFRPVFEKEDITWVGHNIKYDMMILKWYGRELKGKIFDTMLAHYVIDPDGKRNMDMLAEKGLENSDHCY